jgi:hypothetical protein
MQDIASLVSAAVANAMAPLAAALGQIVAKQAEQAQTISALSGERRDVDTAVAAAMDPRNGMYIASQSGENVVHGNSTEAKEARVAGIGEFVMGEGYEAPEHLKGAFSLLQGAFAGRAAVPVAQ